MLIENDQTDMINNTTKSALGYAAFSCVLVGLFPWPYARNTMVTLLYQCHVLFLSSILYKYNYYAHDRKHFPEIRSRAISIPSEIMSGSRHVYGSTSQF